MRPLIIALTLLAADDRYGYNLEQLNGSAAASVESETLQFPYLTPELKALPVTARARAVTSLGTMVRAYVESAQFKQVYADWVTNSRAHQPVPKRSADAIYAEKKAEIDKTRASMDAQLASLPPAQRDQIKQAYETGLTQQLAMYKDQSLMDRMEEQRFQHEKASYDESIKKYPDDYRVLLRQRLQKFLDQTADVDFSAKTTGGNGGSNRFVNTAYETNPDLWKRAFRAGKPATDTARAFAQGWLASLK